MLRWLAWSAVPTLFGLALFRLQQTGALALRAEYEMKPGDVTFQAIDLDRHADTCVSFRRDSLSRARSSRDGPGEP